MAENQQTAGEPVAWEAKYKAAREVIGELCDGKRRWTMSVPARPDHDPDLVICDALDTMRRALLTHPRPRVVVTEAMMKAAVRAQCGESLGDQVNTNDTLVARRVRAKVRAALEAALALAYEAAPGVVETGFFAVADRNDVPVRNGFGTDERYAARIAEKMSGSHPECAPWRVMRVCLKPLANGGGEVARG